MAAKKPRRRRPNATGRNDTDRFLPISYDMAQSPAWRSLSGPAVKVWVELRSRFNGQNNGALTLSMDEATRLLKIGKATAQRAFAELTEKGFIVKTRDGHWYGRMATQWAVTDRALQGNLPTNAWKSWRPKKQSLGSVAEHMDPATVPPENREPKICSASEPVRSKNRPSLGSETERLYNHAIGRER